MVAVEFDHREVQELAAQLPSATVRVSGKVAVVVRAAAAQVERYAKQIAPVDTGALRNSISTTYSGGGLFQGLTAEIGAGVHYGGFVEYGTSRMAPQPYLGPALDRVSAEFAGAVAAAAADPFGPGR